MTMSKTTSPVTLASIKSEVKKVAQQLSDDPIVRLMVEEKKMDPKEAATWVATFYVALEQALRTKPILPELVPPSHHAVSKNQTARKRRHVKKPASHAKRMAEQ
jgi:hypothetical protein